MTRHALRGLSAVAAVAASLSLALPAASPASGIAGATPVAALSGTWSAPQPLPVAPAGRSAAVLATGEVLVVGAAADRPGTGAAVLLDPVTGALTVVDPPSVRPGGPPRDLAHATVAIRPDGTALVAGGGASGSSTGRVLSFDPWAGVWTDHGPLVAWRHDALVVPLEDGRAVIYAGDGPAAGVVEVVAPRTGSPGSLTVAEAHPRERDPARSQRAAVTADGRVRVSGSLGEDAAFLDVETFRFSIAPDPLDVDPLRPRALPLPTGEAFWPGDAAGGPEVRSPAGVWAAVAAPWVPRTDAAHPLLLPDGRVVVLGSDGYETFSPAYLADEAPRPAILEAPMRVDPGGALAIAVAGRRSVARAVLVPPAADPDVTGRIVELAVTEDDAGTVLGVPVDAPPGHHMLVVIDDAGVPSPARWVAVGVTPAPGPPRGHDDDAPGIARTNPAPGSLRVPVDAPVLVDFGEAVDPTTVDGIRLERLDGRDATPVGAAVVPVRGDTGLVVTPSRDLVPGARYRVTLPAGVTDVAGNPSRSAAVWAFRTAPRPPALAVPVPVPVAEPGPRPRPDRPGSPPGPEEPLTPPPSAGEPPAGTVVFRSGYEPGDLSRFGVQSVAPDRITTVRLGAGHVGRFEVRRGDQWRGSSGNRAEVTVSGDEGEGDIRWYSWRTMFPASYPRVTDGFQIVTQWHATVGGSQPMLVFYAGGDGIGFRSVESGADLGVVRSVSHWSAPMNRGSWHSFRLGVRWSADRSRGWVELFHNGRRVLARTAVAGLIPGYGVMLKQGLYRSADIAPAGVVYHDDLLVTTAPATGERRSTDPRAAGG